MIMKMMMMMMMKMMMMIMMMMMTDIPGTIKSLSAFLQHPVPAESLDKLAENLKFENMKKNPHITPTSGVNLPGKSTFMRKGIVGDCKNHFDEEMMR